MIYTTTKKNSKKYYKEKINLKSQKSQNVTILKYSICDKTQKKKFIQNSKTQILT